MGPSADGVHYLRVASKPSPGILAAAVFSPVVHHLCIW